MAVFTCPHCNDVIELLGEPTRQPPECDCGAIMEPLELADAPRVADYVLSVLAPAGS